MIVDGHYDGELHRRTITLCQRQGLTKKGPIWTRAERVRPRNHGPLSESKAMCAPVTDVAQRNQILISVAAGVAAQFLVMNLKV